MLAAWYTERGPARDVLVVGELPDPHPGAGEVRIALATSGLSPGDVKKREGWQGSPMPYPRVIPHSDGAGVVDEVGEGVSIERLGQRVFCFGAQSYRAFGTAAQYVVVPESLAVAIPASDQHDEAWMLDQASCLGIAGITGYRAVFSDGPVRGLSVLIWGATGGVGSIATQMALRDGGRVIAAVRAGQADRARSLGVEHVVDADGDDVVAAIRAVAPDGVDRVADVDFSAHIEVNADVVALGSTICAYYSSADRPAIPYWKLGFADTCLRLLGSDDFSAAVKETAAAELIAAVSEGALQSHIARRLPLAEIAAAHELVDAGAGGRVLIDIPAVP